MRADALAVVEATYTQGCSTQAWLDRILAAAAPTLDLGLGVATQHFVIDAQGVPRYTQGAATGSHGEELIRVTNQMVAEAREHSRSGFVTQVGLLSELLAAPGSRFGPEFTRSHFQRLGGLGGAKDVFGVVGGDSSGRGIVMCSLVPSGWRPTQAFARPWRYVAAHLACGTRLHDLPEASPDEAVLDAKGKLYDAVGDATSRDAQTALRSAAKAIDRARAQRSRAPDAALEGWRALVEARWSLVDRFDSDGRTFLIAKANPPKPPLLRKLTDRERAVVALAALGRSNKLIAYELGLAIGTVGNYLVRAQRKLGIRSRLELIRTFHSTLLSEAVRDRSHED